MGKTKNNSKRLLVDFDRVIHKYSDGWKDGSIYDVPVEGAIEAIKKLQEQGYEIMVFTTRSKRGDDRNDDILGWLAKHGLSDISVTNTKHPARAIIDDRAIRFTHWRDILSYFI